MTDVGPNIVEILVVLVRVVDGVGPAVTMKVIVVGLDSTTPPIPSDSLTV